MLMKLNEIYAGYTKEDVLAGISLTLNRGDFVGIVGPNGAGKTTLLKVIAGILRPRRGEIYYGDANTGESRHSEARKINTGYVAQNLEVDRRFPVSVREVVHTGFLRGAVHPFHRCSPAGKARVEEILAKLGLLGLADRLTAELSGGELQRVLLARALVGEPELLLLDEPTRGIDRESKKLIYNYLRQLNTDGMTILLVTHDWDVVDTLVGRAVYINREVAFDGNPAELTRIQ